MAGGVAGSGALANQYGGNGLACWAHRPLHSGRRNRTIRDAPGLPALLLHPGGPRRVVSVLTISVSHPGRVLA